MIVLGLNAFHGDAAVAALAGGKLVAGVEEERFRRVKHWAGFPAARDAALPGRGGRRLARRASGRWRSRARAAGVPLAQGGAGARRIPGASGGLLARVRNLTPVGALEERIAKARCGAHDGSADLFPVEHHVAHLASAFYCSPFEEAACLSVDGFGDFVSTMLARGARQPHRGPASGSTSRTRSVSSTRR